ncbi:MAG: immunoglobulin-like domain-containing protein [Lacrimispora saccharolytica]
MKKGLVAMLFLACAALLAGNVVVYIGEDRKGPEISVPQEEITYVAGTDTSALLNGVTAQDNRDGDVTDTVTIESIIPNADQTGASVIYVAKDSKNNVTKETRTIVYSTDAAQAAVAAADQAAQNQAAADPAAAQGDAAGESAQTVDDGAAQNEAAIAALPAESPRFYLTQYSVEVERGADFNELSYVQDISDDKDSRDELYQGIQISGEVDTNTPGEYTLEYHVVDSDGNNSNAAQLKVTVKE